MQTKCICFLLFGFLLSGCGLWGPNYINPDIDKDNTWKSKDNLSLISSSPANLPDSAWWLNFNDPVLNSLITDALKNNNSIQQAIGNIIQAKGQLEQVQMGWVPTLGFVPSYSQSGGSGSNAGYNPSYSAGLVPAYTLNILQQLRMSEAAKANLLAARYTKDAMRLAVLSQVAGSYFTLSEQNELLFIQNQLVKNLGELYVLAQAQYKDGYISLLSLQTYLQNYQAAKSQIPIITNNIVVTQNAIQALINGNPSSIMLKIKFKDIVMNGIIPANIPSVVLKQRPDIAASEQQLIVANADIGVATSNFFPAINLTGGAGLASNSLSGLFNSNNNFWQIAAKATFPLVDLAAFGQIKTAKGAYYTAYYNYINTVRTAFQEVDNGLSAHQKITDSYNEQVQVYESAKTSYKLTLDAFNEGVYSKLQLLKAKITVDQAMITLVGLKLQQLQSIVSLYQALAGGYKVQNTEQPNKFGDGRDS